MLPTQQASHSELGQLPLSGANTPKSNVARPKNGILGSMITPQVTRSQDYSNTQHKFYTDKVVRILLTFSSPLPEKYPIYIAWIYSNTSSVT
jgi:uncharacterized Zn-finger protein